MPGSGCQVFWFLLGTIGAQPRSVYGGGARGSRLRADLWYDCTRAAADGTAQRREQIARSGLAGDVAVLVARRRCRRGAYRLDYQRHTFPFLDLAGDEHAIQALPGRRLGRARGRAGFVEARDGYSRRGVVANAYEAERCADCLRPAQPEAATPAAG